MENNLNKEMHIQPDIISNLLPQPIQSTIKDRIFRIKPIQQLPYKSENSKNLKKSLTLLSLLLFGIGNTLGAGVFALLGVAAQYSGPSLFLTFLICGLVVYLTALVFAEFSSRMPQTGSQFEYVYSTFGELPAWMIGWNMNMRYGVSAGALIRGWSLYVVALFACFGVTIPKFFYSIDILGFDCSIMTTLYIVVCTFILTLGIRQSDVFNKILTTMKILCLTLIIIVGFTQFNSDNFSPFFVEQHGFYGTIQAILFVFFTCIGFDFISTLAEEAKNPRRDLPIACQGSVITTTCIYITIALAVCGMYRLELFGGDETALALAFGKVGFKWMEYIIYVAAIFGISGGAFTKLMSQPRVLYAFARDGLFFKVFSEIHPKSNVPVKGAWIVCIFVSLISFFFDLEELSKIISLVTLFNYCIINAALISMRYRQPQPFFELIILRSRWEYLPFIYLVIAFIFGLSIGQQWHYSITIIFGILALVMFVILSVIKQHNIPVDTFRCPLVPFIPCLAILCNCILISFSSLNTWVYFLVFESIGATKTQVQ